ncbi:AAA family ATPase [Desulfovibrionaceae bacterium CB1MN]|uniref:AAA family ATPase n=1 Tax=Hydrosulfovibrio ferrireducens TaxID=2934181 RepID=UPI003ABB5317
MLQTMQVKHFTVFDDERFQFAPGINVIIGENGTGKSQLMKLGYALSVVSHAQKQAQRKGKEEWQRAIADKLIVVCQPESLGRLVSRKQGRNRCEIGVKFTKDNADFKFSFATNSKTEVRLSSTPSEHIEAPPVFFPTREMLSIFPGFAAIYRNRELEFDETYYDLALALEARPLKGKRTGHASSLIDELEKLMKGRVGLENGHFYLYPFEEGKGRIEMPLVAEGIRKIAMMTYLLINGGLKDRGTLFWDEPETNLNPRLMQSLAGALVAMAHNGVQIVLATHSLFLLRELDIALTEKKYQKVHRQYIALALENDDVRVSQSDSLDDVNPIAVLDADLEQSDRYLDLSGDN